MDKSRSDFEDWCKTKRLNIERGVSSGDYASLATYDYWELWQASRAVEIDFTNAYIVCEGENTYSSIDINDVYKLITEAGYKFKE